MKVFILLFLSVLGTHSIAWAGYPIRAVYLGKSSYYPKYILEQLERVHEGVRDYLEDEQDCQKVKLCVTELNKSSVWGAKPFSVTLTASCAHKITKVSFITIPVEDDEDIYAKLSFSTHSGNRVSKEFDLGRPRGDLYLPGSNPNKVPALPFCFE